MFECNITVFNYSYNEDKYYSKLIKNTEVQPMYKIKPETDYTTSETSTLILIPTTISNGKIYINNSDNKLIYLSPKEWTKSEDKLNTITFHNNTDFIICGDHTDIVDIDLNSIKNNYDNVFVINSIKNYVELGISHFELIAN